MAAATMPSVPDTSKFERLLLIGDYRYTTVCSDADYYLGDPGIADDFHLVTVFHVPKLEESKVTEEWIQNEFAEYKLIDDVFSEQFLEGVVLQPQGHRPLDITEAARAFLQRHGNKWINSFASPKLQPGPYAAVHGYLRDAWKLVDDSHGTCMVSIQPHAHDPSFFEELPFTGSDGSSLCVALRSRLKRESSSRSPIAGFRILVKDNIHVKDLKTSVGNKAFFETYPPQERTAECVQRLLDEGVIISGKAKMSSFGGWEEPMEYVDYQAPWNPRADGYQSTGGSSSGSAAAVAAYDWLDIAIGSDTWASVTRPTLWCGCFGLRPTLGAVSTVGVEPYCDVLDTPGFIGRDLDQCRRFAGVWLLHDALVTEVKSFTNIIWPLDFWNIIDRQQCDIAQGFMASLAIQLGVKHEDASFRADWEQHPPHEARGKSLAEFINAAVSAPEYDGYRNFQGFRERYQERFSHAPYVSPATQDMWKIGQSLSKKARDQAFENIGVYRRWFVDRYMLGPQRRPIIVLPLENMAPRYRDQMPTFPRPPQEGINALWLGPVMGAPVLSIPLAEIPYRSNITRQEEKLPFVVALMAPQGYDLVLMDVVFEALKSTGRRTAVRTGKQM